jgi:hypothetical protein
MKGCEYDPRSTTKIIAFRKKLECIFHPSLDKTVDYQRVVPYQTRAYTIRCKDSQQNDTGHM